MCANQVAEEERVIETKLAEHDPDPGCKVAISVADA